MSHEEYYNRVIRHFRETRTLGKVIAKFPPKAIESAVKKIFKRYIAIHSDPEEFDWVVHFETLTDHDTIDSFISELEDMRLIPKEIEDVIPKEIEDVTSLSDLLSELEIPELPDPDDPNAPMKMEEITRQLAERLKEAEYMAGKVKVTVAGKTHIWGANKIYQFVDELNQRIAALKEEKEALIRKLEEKPVTKTTVKIIQYTPAFIGADGKAYGPFYAGQVVELPEASATYLIRQGAADPYAKPTEQNALRQEAETLWNQYTDAVVNAESERASTILARLKEIRPQVIAGSK